MRRTAPLVKPRVTDDGIWRRQVLTLLHHSIYSSFYLLYEYNEQVLKRDLAPPGPEVTSLTEKVQILQKKYKY